MTWKYWIGQKGRPGFSVRSFLLFLLFFNLFWPIHRIKWQVFFCLFVCLFAL